MKWPQEPRFAFQYARVLDWEGDFSGAFQWFRRAADVGYARAQFRVAQIYSTGHGVPRSTEKANMWFLKAAELGDPDAQVEIATSYENGWGIGRNVDEAIHWYEKAADQGSWTGKSNLQRMRKYRRESVAED